MLGTSAIVVRGMRALSASGMSWHAGEQAQPSYIVRL